MIKRETLRKKRDKLEKIRQIGKRGKIGKARQNREGSFTLPLLTEGWLHNSAECEENDFATHICGTSPE